MNEIGPGHLSRLLGRGVVAVRELQRFEGDADYIARLALDYAPGQIGPSQLICKVFGPGHYAVGGLPELYFYRELAPQTPQVPVPALYAGEDDAPARTVRLLIQDLTPDYHPVSRPAPPALLEQVTDLLVRLQAPWWDSPSLEAPAFFLPDEGVTRMPQALDPAGLAEHAEAGRRAIESLITTHFGALTLTEGGLLEALHAHWPDLFAARVAAGQLTLLHGDLHLLGNVFVSATGDLCLIDWGQIKRGLGPHDLMYTLLSADALDRVARDMALLRRYHAGLRAAGVTAYPFEQCLWDYRFSLLTNVFQSCFQGSLHWLRVTLQVVAAWQAQRLLSS